MNVCITLKILVHFITIYPNVYLFNRLLQINNFMHRMMNADIPVIYAGVGVQFYVKFVIRNSVKRAV